MDSYALHLAMAAIVGASFVAVSAYYVHCNTLSQLLEFARAVERERERDRDRSQNENRNKNRALKKKGEVEAESEEAEDLGIPLGLPKLHTAPADEGNKQSVCANSNKLSGKLTRPTSPKSPGASAYGSLEGSDDDDDTLPHDAQLDNSYLPTNGDLLKSVRVCGPRYWPQVIHLVPEDKPWWRSGDKNDPFNGGLLYIKRKVGSCSYVDDPVGCQSLLSRAMHKIFDTSFSYNSAPRFGNSSDLGSFNVEQLVSAFSADPSLIAFSQLCCGSTWNSRSDSSFQDFCSQVLFECISKDRPALLQVYLSLYTIIGSMWEQVNSSHFVFYDSCFLSSLKLALAYNEALMSGKLTWAKGGIIQSTFLESIRKHLEEILERSLKLKGDLYNYLNLGEWPNGELVDSMLLAWYLQWYSVPPTHVVKSASEKIKGKVTSASSVVPLLHLLLPNTHIRALTEIDKFLRSPKC